MTGANSSPTRRQQLATGSTIEKEVFMKSLAKKVLVAVALAGLGVAAFSQMPLHAGMEDGHHSQDRSHGHMDAAKMKEHMEKQAAALKEKLKLTAAQQASWATYVDAMKPINASMEAHPDHAQMGKLTTPERIEKMKAMHDQRNAEMERHTAATKAFYATLNVDQKKIFDTETMKMEHGGGRREHHGRAHKSYDKQDSKS